MKPTTLSPAWARQTLNRLGRSLYDTRPETMWSRDTQQLSRPLRRLRRAYRRFARAEISPLARAADADPSSVDLRELFRRSARAGFQSEFMPRPFGTMSLRATAESLLLPSALKAEEFCAADGGLGLGLLAHELGVAPLFVSGDLRAYTQHLRQIYREVRSGEPSIVAFAITEPGAGSDVEDTEGAAHARLGCFYERVNGGFKITGRKCFISNGALARWVTLFAAEKGHGLETWTCFLLDDRMEGFSVGRKERKLGQRASDASEIALDDVFVPTDRVIGEVGAGWGINRNVLNFSRPVVGAIALGIARGAFEQATAFCQTARFGGAPLMERQEVQLALSDMLLKLHAMRATVWHTARYRIPIQSAGSMTKVFCGDAAWEVCNSALQLMGDHGCLQTHGVEKAARDARLTQLYEGTNQINRLSIFEGQVEAEFKTNP